MTDAKNAFRAGLVVVVGTAIAVFFFVSSSKTSLDDRNSVAHHAFLLDAAGINAKSLITVAGLQVGEIQNLTLVPMPIGELIPDFDARSQKVLDPSRTDIIVEKNEEFDGLLRRVMEQTGSTTLDDLRGLKGEPVRVARVDLRVNSDVKLPKDTWVRKESLGVLGAKALFLELGRSTEDIAPGGRIVNVRSMTGTDALLAAAEGIVADVRSITRKLDNDVGGITSDIRGITSQLNRFVNGDGDSPPLDELYKVAMTDLRKLTRTIDDILRDAQGLIRDNDGQFKQVVANVARITNDIADLLGDGRGSPASLATVGGAGGGGVGGAGGAGGAGAAGPAFPKGTTVVIREKSDGSLARVATLPDGTVVEEPVAEGDLRATMRSVRTIANDLTSVTGQLKELLGDNSDDIASGAVQLKETITELNRTLASLSEVAGRVERGEGTVGRLLTDDQIADKVEAAVSGAADFVASLTSLETHVDVGSWYNVGRERTTTTLSLKLQPKPDKFYLVEIVDDGGNLERLVRTERDGEDIRSSIREEDNQIRITAMFAKRFFDFLVLRAGLIETTGGVGANIFLWDNRVELRSDLFGTRGPRDSLVTDEIPFYMPRWRTLVKAQPIPHLYISAGVDDVLNAWDFESGQGRLYTPLTGFGFDYFVGIGLTFKDDDLRTILPFIPGG